MKSKIRPPAEIEAAVAFAEAGTWEDAADLERDVLTPVEEATREPAR